MRMNPLKLFKSFDIFTKEVKLNKGGEEEHKTQIGGVFSAFLKLMYFGYFIYLLNKMFTYNEDRTF